MQTFPIALEKSSTQFLGGGGGLKLTNIKAFVTYKRRYENINKLQDNNVWKERKPTRCNNKMFIIKFCLNMFRASLCPSSGEQKPYVTACGVLRWFCWMWLVVVVGRCVVGCEHCEGYCSTRVEPHPAEPAQHTTCSNTRSLFSWRWG